MISLEHMEVRGEVSRCVQHTFKWFNQKIFYYRIKNTAKH